MLYLLLIYLGLAWYVNGITKVETIPAYEYEALVDLYNSTNGPDWLWRSTRLYGPVWFNASSPCDWQGIGCTCVLTNCHVTRLDLAEHNLRGRLPLSLGNFSQMVQLNFQDNQLTGSLPSTLGRLSLLTTFSVPDNELNGSLPEEFYNCTNLKILLLLDNKFSGSLSERFGQFSNLSVAYFDNNKLTGSIPTSIGQLANLIEINFQNNSFVGTLPNEITNCSRLVYLSVEFNDIEGPIPANLSALTELVQFVGSGNRLSGTIPQDIGRLYKMLRFAVTSNRMWGTIPSSIGNLSELNYLYLSYNNFNGTLPTTLYDCESLHELFLTGNQFSGTISSRLEKLKTLVGLNLGNNLFTGVIPVFKSALVELYINNNQLNGTLPDSLFSRDLKILDVSENQITGSLPSNITSSRELLTLQVFNNNMDGSLPVDLCALPKLSALYIYSNYFSGSIPECLFYGERNSALLLYDNDFSGSLPAIVSGSISKLIAYGNQLTGEVPVFELKTLFFLDLSDNQMSGVISAETFDGGNYQQVALQHNLLTGSVPWTLGNCSDLEYLDLSNNVLSGSLPSSLTWLTHLSVFYVGVNHLSGRLHCFDNNTQRALTNVDVSNNHFTGPLPIEAFRTASLETFTAVSNCFTGSISEEICGLQRLTVLALDGMHTATTCRINLLPALTHNYGLEYWAPGHLPSCLFNMPMINTLHVCGNGIVGSLPYDMPVSSSLQNLAMSYNLFTGSIPYQLQKVAFDTFDLSYNNFYGLLIPQIDDLNANATVYYHVNRLSGRIPEVLRDKQDINILEGNHFQCEFDRAQLPKNDPEYGSYQCGTSSLQRSMYSFLGLFLLLLMLILGILMLDRFGNPERFRKVVQWCHQTKNRLFGGLRIFYQNNYSDHMNNITLMGLFMNHLRAATVLCMLVVIFVILPVDITIKSMYSTYQDHYAWIVSSIDLSGINPAAVLTAFYTLFLAFFFAVFFNFFHSFVNTDIIETNLNPKTVRDNYLHYIWMVVIAVFNLAVVLSVNIGYVVASLEASPTQLVFAQIALAVFKMLWNDLTIRKLNQLAYRLSTRNLTLSLAEERQWKRTYLLFNTYLLIFNVVVVPWMATASVSPDCFYNVLFEPKNIVSTVSYESCTSFENAPTVSSVIEANCTSYSEVVTTTTFLPPFIYRYQCSSTLVTTYAVLYVYKFVIVAFLQPFGIMYVNYLTGKLKTDSKLLSVLVWLLPPVATQTGDTLLTRQVIKIFRADRFHMRVVMYLAIFVTFGVVFPPLAVMACVTVYTQSYFIQLSIGNIINSTSSDTDRLKLLECLDADCANMGEIFKKTLYVVGPPAAFFYAFVVFDTYGDAVGGENAIWLAIVVFILGLGITAAFSYGTSREVVAPTKPRVYSVDKIQMKVFNSVFRESQDSSYSDRTLPPTPGVSPSNGLRASNRYSGGRWDRGTRSNDNDDDEEKGKHADGKESEQDAVAVDEK